MAKGTAGKILVEKAVGDTKRPTADRQVNRLFSDLAHSTSIEVGRAGHDHRLGSLWSVLWFF